MTTTLYVVLTTGILEEPNLPKEEGLAFYAYGVGAGKGTEFTRFQNNQNNTFLFAEHSETEIIENDPNFSAIFTNQGVAFESLV